MLAIINQVFELEQKLQSRDDLSAERNFKRIFHEFEEMGYRVINPINRKYSETDSDIEATLPATLNGDLRITRVLKPVIYQKGNIDDISLVQKGIVIVEAV
ncbi:hypothetical protein KXD93_18630 [Mucilaginibacter sp. BJC16-A38]|uniref:hypothetical protein n=1 Tax=Mucilaginibacter phenanthrenivorans TaxID=1234842 RepID=UPI002157A154|nr:hypothetical protein [Mucilaginibacter phenanthrenivorans]MCR8559679.1 hypothetical protein [Mucilaginibacter phenanthrenivorans]